MDNISSTPDDIQEQGPRKGIVIIVISILLGTNALLLWQFFEKKSNLEIANQTIVSTNAEKDALRNQLTQIQSDYEKMKAENTNLQTQLSSKDEEIKAKVAEIQRLIAMGGPAQIAKAKAEMARLKEMSNLYQLQIDSLNKVNSALKTKNKNLNTNLDKEQSKNQNLSAENSKLATKIAAGSVLKAMNITTEGLYNKSSGKEVITNKAKKVGMMRTKFLLTENKVVDKGELDLYLRVLGPDGGVMTADHATFKSSSAENLEYTTKESVDYNNEDTPVQIVWAKGTQFAKGKYSVEVYCGGNLIGKSTAELK